MRCEHVIALAAASLATLACSDKYPRYHQLIRAIDAGPNAVRTVLASGANPNNYPPPSSDEDDMAPINAGVESGNVQIVGLLLDAGADIEAVDPWGGPPLNLAARNGDLTMMKYLIKRGAKINDMGHDGSSSLYGSAVTGKIDALKYLLSCGADPNSRIYGESALQAAKDLNQQRSVKILEHAGALVSKSATLIKK